MCASPDASWSEPPLTQVGRFAAWPTNNRGQRLLAEAGRFLTVGGVATIAAFILFNLLVHGLSTGGHAVLGDQPIVAYIVANTVGMVISYRGTRSWAFRDRPPRQSDGGRSAYVLINVVTMSLPVGCLMISRDVLGLDDPLSDNIAANVIGLLLGLGARFYLFRRFVFQQSGAVPGHALGAEDAEFDETVSGARRADGTLVARRQDSDRGA